MRDIVYRGRRTDNGEWTYGYLLQDESITRAYVITWIEVKGFERTKEVTKLDLYIQDFVEVLPETVGQYTGHTDVDKDKIFDGDRVILNEDFDEVFTVEWDNETARFVIEGNGVCYDFDNVMDYQIQVVGKRWQGVEE